MIRKAPYRYLAAFLRDTRGSVSVELALVAPFLFWSLMACYTYFDGYRQSASSVKAANTVADMISRETEAINDAYVDSMHQVLKLMMRVDTPVSMRVSVVRWDADEGRYYTDWSTVRDRTQPLTNDTLQEITDKLPAMPDNDRVILVETASTYTPAFRIGLHQAQLQTFVFTRPRFAPLVVWAS